MNFDIHTISHIRGDTCTLSSVIVHIINCLVHFAQHFASPLFKTMYMYSFIGIKVIGVVIIKSKIVPTTICISNSISKSHSYVHDLSVKVGRHRIDWNRTCESQIFCSAKIYVEHTLENISIHTLLFIGEKVISMNNRPRASPFHLHPIVRRYTRNSELSWKWTLIPCPSLKKSKN